MVRIAVAYKRREENRKCERIETKAKRKHKAAVCWYLVHRRIEI